MSAFLYPTCCSFVRDVLVDETTVAVGGRIDSWEVLFERRVLDNRRAFRIWRCLPVFKEVEGWSNGVDDAVFPPDLEGPGMMEVEVTSENGSGMSSR